MLGATDLEMADFFEVNPSTFYKWKNEHPEFSKAVTIGKEHADARVERSLYQRAIGYRHKAVKIFMPAGATEPIYAEYIEEYPPDTVAASFWLRNRRPEIWRDVQKHEVGGVGAFDGKTDAELAEELHKEAAELGIPLPGETTH